MKAIPTGWTVVRLDQLVEILDGRRIPVSAPERAKRPGEVPYYGASGQVGTIDKALFDESLLLLGEDGVQFFDPLKSKAYQIRGRSWVNNHAHVLRVKAGTELTLLEYYLNQFDYRGFANGTTRLKLTQAAMRRIPVVLPDLKEQQRIVAILEEHFSDLDAGLSYVDSAATRLVHLRRAELDRIFGPGVGPTLPLGDLIADVSAGKSFGSAERPAAPGEWGIIKVSAMTWGEFRSDENKAVSADRVDPRFEIRAGDLLVSRANTSDYVGASVLVPAGVRPKLLLSDKSLRVLPRPDINPEWLWRALQAPGARRQMSVLATGTKESMRNISQESLKRVVVPVVNGSEQGKSSAEFAEIESAIRRQLGILASLRSRAGGLRCAVLAAAFSGRLTGRGSDTNVIEKLAEEESA